MMNMFIVYCESSYNNLQSEESIQITEKKEPDANCLGTQAKPTFFCIKCETFLCLNKNKNCFKTFRKN